MLNDIWGAMEDQMENFENEQEDNNNQMETHRYNFQLEVFQGSGKGNFAQRVLDLVITSNKKEERKITVKYEDTETQDESEIKSIKREIETFDDYEITYEYDEEGFINKAIIEKI